MIKNIIRNSYTIIKTIEPKKAFLLGILFIIFVIAIITFTLSSLSRLTSSYNDYNNELNIGTTQNIKYYISPFAIGEMEKNINKLLFSGLIKKDTPNKNNLENNLINDLAKTITYNNNNTEIVVELRDDIYFSNGDPITTDDVIWTYQLFKNTTTENEYNAIFDGIEYYKETNKKLRIQLKSPYYDINYLLKTGIISKSWGENKTLDEIKDITIDNKWELPYSGQYKISNIESHNDYFLTRLVRNENYYELPKIKEINIYNYKSITTSIEAFNNRDIDIIYDIDNEYINNTITEYKKYTYTIPIINLLFFNSNRANILAKNNERNNIRSVIDSQYIIDNLLAGEGNIKNNIIQLSKANTLNIQNDKIKTTSKKNNNKDKTNNSTSTSDTDNRTLTLTIVDNEKIFNIANYIKDRLSTLGYSININKLKPQEIYNDIIKDRDFDLLIYGIEINSPNELYLYLHSSQKDNPGLNITTIYDKNLDILLNNLKSSTNTKDKTLLLEKINNIISNDNIVAPLYQNTRNVIIREDYSINLLSSINHYGEMWEDLGENIIKTEYIWPIFYQKSINQFINKLFY